MMDDLREKVIKGLECCSDRRKNGIDRCVECPYNDWMITCAGDVLIDALSLLKAQEKIHKYKMRRLFKKEEYQGLPSEVMFELKKQEMTTELAKFLRSVGAIRFETEEPSFDDLYTVEAEVRVFEFDERRKDVEWE